MKEVFLEVLDLTVRGGPSAVLMENKKCNVGRGTLFRVMDVKQSITQPFTELV